MCLRGRLDQNTYFRQEANGLLFYDLLENQYRFYENTYIKNKEALVNLDFSTKASSMNIDLQYPICVCCLTENKCNLDCVYCYGEDKMYVREHERRAEELYASLLKMNPIQVSLGGGEPTLNPQLDEIIRFLGKHEIAVVLDTNGTTDSLKRLIPALKEAGALVRISIDAMDDEIIQTVRPWKRECKKSEAALIERNLDLLLSSGIPVAVHTVLTKRNMNEIPALEKFLQKKEIRRWHITGVKYSQKCNGIFDEIAVSKQDMQSVMRKLHMCGTQMYVTCSFEEDFAPNVRIFFDVNGKFLVDSVFHGLTYLENAVDHVADIYRYLDKERHIQLYLGEYDI